MEIKPGGGKHGVLVAAAGDDDVESLPTPVSPMPPEMPPAGPAEPAQPDQPAQPDLQIPGLKPVAQRD